MDLWGFIYNHGKWTRKTSEDDLAYLLLLLEQENLYPLHASQTEASSFTLSSLALACKRFS